MNTGMESTIQLHTLERVSQFLREAGRRRVWRTAIAYGAVVFVALQLGEIVFPAFGAPDWALRLLVVACFLGLPVVLALAWAFDITSKGIQRAESDDPESRELEYSGTLLPRLALLAIILLSAGGVGWWTVQDTIQAEASPAEVSPMSPVPVSTVEESPLQVRSLAVLPLDDFSEEEGGEYFTAGLHEELVSQLSQIAAARVISRTSVVQYDASGKAMPEIAADLGVEGVVEGSVFRDGNRVRITVQLIHGPTDQHLWANSYDGTLEDAIGLQRTVAQAIAREIQAELFPEEVWETPETRVASSPRVQEEYLKGRLDQSKATRESLEAAVEHFQAAVEEDSTFAPAYAGLAGARFLLGIQATDSVSPAVLVSPEIVEPLTEALRLDESSPEARAVILSMRESLGDMPDLHLPDGIQIAMDSSGLLEGEIALTSTEYGRQIHRFVVQHQPKGTLPPGEIREQRLRQARRLAAASDHQTAEELIRRTIEEAPNWDEAWNALERVKTAKGDVQGAAELWRQRLSQGPDGEPDQASLEDLEGRMARSGEEGFWSWRVERLEEQRREGEEISSVLLARAYLGLDRPEAALGELEVALQQKDPNLISLWSDPAWDSIRGDPRFRRILVEARPVRREPFPDPGAGI